MFALLFGVLLIEIQEEIHHFVGWEGGVKGDKTCEQTFSEETGVSYSLFPPSPHPGTFCNARGGVGPGWCAGGPWGRGDGWGRALQAAPPPSGTWGWTHTWEYSLAHRNRSDFCDLRLQCPSQTPEIARFQRQEKAMLHCDLRVRCKVASDLRFRAAICEPKTPFFCGISGDLAQSTQKSLAIAIVRFWCAQKCSICTPLALLGSPCPRRCVQ